ncbi:MAG TPA: chromosome segregation SMC family protein [Nitrososphaeraceae archaeon]|nr:chromosome segregation SMC family protein [Nitrososphaeraceae archaeon]
MVYIKKLEIYGFKSFGFKNTVLHLNNGLVAVTGPNGSGKSNILDAIMFALGENSPKLLRVDKFQSLFHDSENSSHRLVRVNLSFDNSDRGIPIDMDTVSMSREMEGQTGESQYYLNGKKVSKNTILELLEIMVAVPNKLNIVQQGMITRISELNSEERRKIIEDIVGLSYFDDKKDESIKQLEESDRRLEVALARMDEIKKRINELEAERNDQLRYTFIESQLKRFKAIKYSNKIRYLKEEINNRNKLLATNESNLVVLSKNREELRREIEKIDLEKSSFMSQVDASNKSKAQIDTKLTDVIYNIEREKAITKEAKLRLAYIEERFTFIESEGEKIEIEFENSNKTLYDKKSLSEDKRSHLAQLKGELEILNSQIDEISYHVNRNKKIRERLFQKKSKLVEIGTRLNILVARLEERRKFNINKINENTSSIEIIKRSLGEKETELKNLDVQTCYSDLDTERKLLDNLKNKSQQFVNEIVAYENTVSKVQKFAVPHEEKYAMAVQLSNEDFAIADLIKNSQEFNVVGIVRDLLRYDDVYKKAVFAVAKDWMKCCIVPTVKEMIRLASHIKEKNLPRFKIISSELLNSVNREQVELGGYDYIGNLADLVHSSIPNLIDFIFGNVHVVRNSKTAYELSKNGYKCVTIAGELFEPHANSVSLDFGSKISDLTKEIILSDSIESLLKNSKILSTHLENKKVELEKINDDILDKETHVRELEKLVGENSINVNHLREVTSSLKTDNEKLKATISSLSGEITDIDTELTRIKKRDTIISSSIANYSTRIQSIGDDKIDKELSELTGKKGEILRKIENLEIENREIITLITSLENGIAAATERKKEISNEKESLQAEQIERTDQDGSATRRLEQFEKELIGLREEEQKIIDVSGDSYSILQNYEKQIKLLDEKERNLYREINGIEKESIAIKKDISNFTVQESQTTNDLVWLGFKELLETEITEVDMLISELTKEYDELKTRLNLRAHETYVQIIDGYRDMSSRKNYLENERNSIVLFITEIDKEKKDVFMDAFKKVDDDIRKTFAEIAGVNAYLQIDNEDVFSGGLSYLVQFQGKPPRESTSLSGGEKTMAATVFLLALQSLKPSPFYLMDEVDAHLDAQNTERLSKVMMDRSVGSQILMVTLKESTVAKASQIFGIYPKAGASQIVHYNNPDKVPLAQIRTSE